jgi:hypothetical protein
VKLDAEKENVELKSLRYVEVHWLDAAVGDSWVSFHGDADIEAAQCISRGWLMRQDDKQVILCGTVGMDKEGLVEEANQTISIPTNMIQSVVDFPKSRRKRKAPEVAVAEMLQQAIKAPVK